MRIPEKKVSKENGSESRRGRRPAPPASVNLSALEQRTGFLLYRVSTVARDIYARRVGQLDMRPAQVGILQILAGSGPIIQGTIADTLGMDRPAIVPLLNELEARGLVFRSSHPDDGRASILQLSEKGAAALERLELLNDEATDFVLSSLTPEEQSQFHDLLMKIYQFLCKEVPFADIQT